MRPTRPALTVLILLALAAAPSQAQEHRVFDLRAGAESLKSFQPFGPNAATMLRADAEGLRINLPADRPETGLVGAELSCKLLGDFTVTLGYELISIGEPVNPGGCGVQLRLLFDTPVPRLAMMTRLRKSMGKAVVNSAAGYCIDGEESQRANWRGRHVTAAETKGKFRIARIGSRLDCFIAEAPKDFAPVWSGECGTEPITALRLTATSGYRPTAVDVLFTDLDIQAAQFAERPVPAEPAVAVPQRRFFLLLGIAVFVLIGLCAALLAVLVFRRKRKSENGSAPPVPGNSKRTPRQK